MTLSMLLQLFCNVKNSNMGETKFQVYTPMILIVQQ